MSLLNLSNIITANVFRQSEYGLFASSPLFNVPWYQSPQYAATAIDGSVVYPTWLFDGINQRYAKSTSPAGAVSAVTFNGLLENFTRASTATYFDSAGVLQTAAVNTPRFTYDPVTLQPLTFLVEEARTNFLLNSVTPATQTVTLAIGTYTLWVTGTGSCTPAAGTAVGTGFATATSTTPDTFTITTAGTVVFTVSGSLVRFQCENGGAASSFIPTSGTAVTRAQDMPNSSSIGFVNASEGTFITVFRPSLPIAFMPLVSLGSATTERVSISCSDSNPFNRARMSMVRSGVVQIASNSSNTGITQNIKAIVGMSYKQDDSVWCLNGGAINADTTCLVPSFTSAVLTIGGNGTASTSNYTGTFETVLYYPKRLTNAEIQRLTTL